LNIVSNQTLPEMKIVTFKKTWNRKFNISGNGVIYNDSVGSHVHVYMLSYNSKFRNGG